VLGLAKDANEAVLKVALLLFLLAVAIGWRFSGGDSYRKIRRRIESQMAIDWRNLSPEEWLRAMIKLEEQIYPELERGADRERKGVLLVQAIVAVQVVLVVLALES
jgi:hypothetical protein